MLEQAQNLLHRERSKLQLQEILRRAIANEDVDALQRAIVASKEFCMDDRLMDEAARVLEAGERKLATMKQIQTAVKDGDVETLKTGIQNGYDLQMERRRKISERSWV